MTELFLGSYRNGCLSLDADTNADTITLSHPKVTAIGVGIIFDCPKLGIKGSGRSGNVAENLAIAYSRWGDNFAGHLIGQFCGVIIDDREDQVLLVQDSFGLQPLFYTSAANVNEVLFSTRLSRLLHYPGLRTPLLDIEYFADFLALSNCCTERTPFIGIKRLTAGMTVRWHRGYISIFRPWQPCDSVIRLQPAEKEERLRELLRESMTPFTNTAKPVWCDVSGGLDSTTVYEIARRTGVPVEPFSVISRESLDDGDTEILCEFLSSDLPDWHRLDVSDLPPFGTLPDIAGDEPGGEIGFALRRSVTRLRQRYGVNGLLSGMGGDQVFGSRDYMPTYLADYWCQFRWKSLYDGLRHWQMRYPEPRSILFWFYHYALCPWWTHIRHRRITNATDTPPLSWIRADFSSKFGLHSLRQRLNIPRHRMPGRNMLWQEVFLLATVEAASRSHAYSHDYYYPLFYRPLVEFMLSVPFEDRRSADLDRILQRRALRGLLPRVILERLDKGSGQSAFDRSFREAKEWHQLLKDKPRIVELGIADAEAWGAAIDRARFGYYESLAGFCASISIEMWLRTHRY